MSPPERARRDVARDRMRDTFALDQSSTSSSKVVCPTASGRRRCVANAGASSRSGAGEDARSFVGVGAIVVPIRFRSDDLILLQRPRAISMSPDQPKTDDRETLIGHWNDSPRAAPPGRRAGLADGAAALPGG